MDTPPAATFVNVSIHAPAGGATFVVIAAPRRRPCFNPRPCGRGDTPGTTWRCLLTRFQSTPLREGRLCRQFLGIDPESVSIHAPAGGATFDRRVDHLARGVSIHAPAGGATVSHGGGHRHHGFQSTPLREGRQGATLRISIGYKVSIHAPAGGATFTLEMRQVPFEFQSTPLREGRRARWTAVKAKGGFQSTPLREGRHLNAAIAAMQGMFQSTPLREGRRALAMMPLDATRVSIHAPAGGATVAGGGGAGLSEVSIHAPAGGATRNRPG